MFARKKNTLFLLVFLVIISIALRFYNLNWGAPFYFHPDERNIASSVSQLNFPQPLNPHFFAYGSLPIYAVYLVGIILNFLSKFPSIQSLGAERSIFTVSFEQAILVSRFFSATFSTLLIPLLFLVGKKIKNKQTGVIAALFATFSTGFIQFARFGTFEMWLTILSVLLFYFTLDILRKHNSIKIFLTAVVFAASVATKISHMVLLPLPLLALAFSQFYPFKKDQLLSRLFFFTRNILLFCLLSFFVFFITNPFVFADFNSFLGSMKYETSVALGTLPVFYTGEFVNTFPIVFQFLHIFPFLINPLLTILFIPSFFYLLFVSIKTKNPSYLLLNTYYLILFLSQAFLFAKWTRYMLPTVPFVYLTISITFSHLWHIKAYLSRLLFLLSAVISSLFGFSYFITTFVMPDTRIAAKKFAQTHIPKSSPILSEVYDLGITPFNDSFHNIILFNFYDLDNNSLEYSPLTLSQRLAASDYIILPSQRLLKIRLQDEEHYPKGHAFYNALVSGSNGFQKVYETPCDLFCKIIYLGNPIYSFEETVNVFDRPTVMIFKKTKGL